MQDLDADLLGALLAEQHRVNLREWPFLSSAPDCPTCPRCSPTTAPTRSVSSCTRTMAPRPRRCRRRPEGPGRAPRRRLHLAAELDVLVARQWRLPGRTVRRSRVGAVLAARVIEQAVDGLGRARRRRSRRRPVLAAADVGLVCVGPIRRPRRSRRVSALCPGDDWAALFSSYEEMPAGRAGPVCVPGDRRRG